MTGTAAGKVGVLWRGDPEARNWAAAEQNRMRPLFAALAAAGVAAEPVVYVDAAVDVIRAQLLRLSAVLVWVDPIVGSHDRSQLDALLREVASAGVWVSGHPDVIAEMGTKEVLVRTKELGWGSDAYLYRSLAEMAGALPARLASGGARVLKPNRGNGGIGVWKVQLAAAGAPVGDVVVRVQSAEHRGPETEDLPISAFVARWETNFAGTGCVIDQPFEPRIVDGMIRCYVVAGEVAGFARQSPADATAGPDRILGLPSAKTMFGPTEPRFGALRAQMESDWVPGMRRLLEIDAPSLPVIWDADFLYGSKTASGDDTYVLCEINASCVHPFPEPAVAMMARAVAARLNSIRASS